MLIHARARGGEGGVERRRAGGGEHTLHAASVDPCCAAAAKENSCAREHRPGEIVTPVTVCEGFKDGVH